MNNLKDKRVCIFVGHLGKDTGAIDGLGDDSIYTREVDLNGRYAHLLSDLLGACGAEAFIIAGSLENRCREANDLHPDASISIHCNAFEDSGVIGMETYSHPNAGELSTLLRNCVHKSTLWHTDSLDRGAKERDYFILRPKNTKHPICLHEIGFITNPAEEALLHDPLFQAKEVVGLADGLDHFFQQS